MCLPLCECYVCAMCVFSVGVGVLYFVCVFYLVFCVLCMVFPCCVASVLRTYVCVVPVLCAAVVRCLL